jgi:ribonuclease J
MNTSSERKSPRKNTRRRTQTRVVRKDDTADKNTTKKPVRKQTATRKTAAKSTDNNKNKRPSHKKNTPRKRRSGGNNNRNYRRTPSRIQDNTKNTKRRAEALEKIPPLADGDIRIVPVCGVEWVGTNMTFIEYKGEIVVIDAGIGFSNPSTPGIDYTIPNIDYLEANKDRVKALVITHGHLDHVGAIPYVIDRLGYPPIYTREFGAMFIQKKMEEFPEHKDKINIQTINKSADYIPLTEHLQVKFFGLTHSIPDSTGVIIKTPYGGIVSTGDVRVENENGKPAQEEIDQYKFFKDEDILLMTMDSTAIEKPGWNISESTVVKNVDEIIKNTNDGRLFIASFASQVERLISFIESAKKYGKYIALDGRSMKSNMAIAQELELTDFGHLIPLEKIEDYPDNKVVVLLTGSQGEEYAALNRIAKGTHKYIKVKRTDTILLSSSVVPGNNYDVAQLKNRLYRGSYNVMTYVDYQVHASGHGAREELKWIHTQIPYKFFMPIHGEPYMTRIHAKLAQIELGVPKENIVVTDNGSIVEIRNEGKEIIMLDEKIPAEPHIVEGKSISEKQDVVFKDRMALAEDGIFIVVVALDPRTGKLKKSPDIISRGFVYLRENQDLLNSVRGQVKRVTESKATKMKNIDFDKLKDTISDTVSKYLTQKTHKNPIVIPVVLGL